MEDNPQWHGKAPDSDIVPIINLELDSQFMIAPSIIAGDMTNLKMKLKDVFLEGLITFILM